MVGNCFLADSEAQDTFGGVSVAKALGEAVAGESESKMTASSSVWSERFGDSFFASPI